MADLSPVAGLVGLDPLDLTGAGVTDLWSVRGLGRLADSGLRNGLTCTDTRASRVDPRLASNVASGLIAEVHGPALIAFVSTHWAILTEVAARYGGSFLSWFHAVMASVPDLRHLISGRPHDR